jgi:hypothetical protein
MIFASIDEEIAYHEGRLSAITQFLFDTHTRQYVEFEINKLQELKLQKIVQQLNKVIETE